MEVYVPNRSCGCTRCTTRGLLGPSILVTLGVLMLLNEFDVVRFHYTWPILLIVIGVVKVLASSAPIQGHRNHVIVDRIMGSNQPPTSSAPPPPPDPSQGVRNG